MKTPVMGEDDQARIVYNCVLIVGEATGVPLGSFAELSCQKIVFELQLADLPVQNIDLRLVGGALRHAALETLDVRPAHT